MGTDGPGRLGGVRSSCRRGSVYRRNVTMLASRVVGFRVSATVTTAVHVVCSNAAVHHKIPVEVVGDGCHDLHKTFAVQGISECGAHICVQLVVEEMVHMTWAHGMYLVGHAQRCLCVDGRAGAHIHEHGGSGKRGAEHHHG